MEYKTSKTLKAYSNNYGSAKLSYKEFVKDGRLYGGYNVDWETFEPGSSMVFEVYRDEKTAEAVFEFVEQILLCQEEGMPYEKGIGKEYCIPQELIDIFENGELRISASFGDFDHCPSFYNEGNFREILVEHPDPTKRRFQSKRFTVLEKSDGSIGKKEILKTDSIKLALKKFLEA